MAIKNNSASTFFKSHWRHKSSERVAKLQSCKVAKLENNPTSKLRPLGIVNLMGNDSNPGFVKINVDPNVQTRF